MDSEAVQVAKIRAEVEAFKALLSNPAVELVAAFVTIEALQRYPANRPLLGAPAGTILEGGLMGVILFQQLAPALPYLAEAGGQIFAAAGKAALVAGAGA